MKTKVQKVHKNYSLSLPSPIEKTIESKELGSKYYHDPCIVKLVNGSLTLI